MKFGRVVLLKEEEILERRLYQLFDAQFRELYLQRLQYPPLITKEYLPFIELKFGLG